MIVGIILAGGGSRRFGSDKLVADLGGRTLLAGTIAAVEMVVDRVVVAGARLPDDATPGGVPVMLVPDRVAFGGPLVALANALAAAPAVDPLTSLALVVGGDMPRVVPAVLTAMLDRLAADPALEAVILHAPNAPRRQVLPVALRVEPATRVATAMLEYDDQSLTGLVQRLRTAELPGNRWRSLDPSGDSIADVDTPEDLERLRSEARRRNSANGAPRA